MLMTKYWMKRALAVWLTAMLLCFTFTVAAHSVEHIDDGAITHCELCFNQSKFEHCIAATSFSLIISKTTFTDNRYPVPYFYSKYYSLLHNRDPPFTLSLA